MHTLDTRVDFVGRTAELAQLRGLLERRGSVTLVGPGGVGKSRLAHEAAMRASRDTARDVTFVALSGAGGEDVFGSVASALGVREELGRNPERALRSALQDSGMIVVIDNCEHVPDESSTLMELLSNIEGVSAIATSQCRLDYAGERIIDVLPFDEETGAEFFMARARLAGIDVLAPDYASVVTIVSRLDGLAIALDLAAARLGALGIAALESELQAMRPYSFRSSSKPERRHLTIGRVVEWTCSHLPVAAQTAFVVAASFRDPFDEQDLAALVGDDAPAAIHALVTHSLLFENEGRYFMLAPIRAVAARMLGGRADRRIYEERFAARMEAVAARERTEPVTALASRYGDYTSALAWALKRPTERLARTLAVSAALTRIWCDGGRFDDGLRWVERVLQTAPSLPPNIRADYYYLAIRVYHAASHFEEMLVIGPTAISSYQITGNTFGLARAYNALAVASLYTNRSDDAQKYVETAVAIFERIGDRRGLGTALSNYGNVLFEGRHEPALAFDRYRASLALLETDGDDNLIGITNGNMAECAASMEHYDEALEYIRIATEAFAKTQNQGTLGWMRQLTARVRLGQNNLEAARDELLLACDLLARSTQLLYTAQTAETAAELLAKGGERLRAAVLFTAAANLRQERRIPATGPEGEHVARTRRRLDESLTKSEHSWVESEAAGIEAAHLPARARAFLTAYNPNAAPAQRATRSA